MDNIWAASPTVALLVTVLIQLAKRSKYFPRIGRDTSKLNVFLSGVAALVTGMGLAITFDVNQETGEFAAGLKGNMYDVAHALMHVPIQWAEQHGIYKLFISLPEAAGETRDIQRQILRALQPVPTAQTVGAAKKPETDVSGKLIEGD